MIKTINIVCYYASIYGGNFIPSILKLALSLKQKDYNVIFTFPNEAKNRNWIKYVSKSNCHLFYANFSNKTFKKEIKNINETNHVNILYTHFLSGLRIKLLYPFRRKIKLLIHVHSDFTGGVPTSLITKIKSFVEHHVLRKDAQYIYVSEIMTKNSNRTDKYSYIKNALSVERIPCEKLDLDEIRKRNNIKVTDTVFLVFAWSPFVKGVDIAVKGFAEGAVGFDNAKLVIVYGKNDGYKNCVSYLTKQLGNNQFLEDSRIVFLPPNEDVFSYYSLSDVFISSSRSEGFSYSILEALYFNLRVLSSNIEGTRWSNEFNNVFSFDIDVPNQLSVLIKDNASFKKSNLINKSILKDFDINIWSDSVTEQIKKL